MSWNSDTTSEEAGCEGVAAGWLVTAMIVIVGIIYYLVWAGVIE